MKLMIVLMEDNGALIDKKVYEIPDEYRKDAEEIIRLLRHKKYLSAGLRIRKLLR